MRPPRRFATAACTSDAVLQTDVSPPDETALQPGERIEKIWRVRNTGTCPWIDYTWVFVSGDKLTATTALPVLRTEPGGTADISVFLQAPPGPGTYEAYWQLRDATGGSVGPLASVLLRVGPEPVASPSSVGTPAPLIRFQANRERLEPGECARLEWDVEHVESVYLDGMPAVGHDGKDVCPEATTRYTLCWHYREQEDCRTITIEVSAPDNPPSE